MSYGASKIGNWAVYISYSVYCYRSMPIELPNPHPTNTKQMETVTGIGELTDSQTFA